jgi:hypothetical protein
MIRRLMSYWKKEKPHQKVGDVPFALACGGSSGKK